MGRARLVRYAMALLLCVVIRALLLGNFPLLLTGDSWDFLEATTAIGQRLDFRGDPYLGLRDTRLPGYPLFQAAFLPLTQLRSDRILVLQAGLGLVGAGLGLAIGRALGSRLVSGALVLFLGLNPIYLMNEHALMSEGLSLVVLLGLTLAALEALRRGLGPGWGLTLGLLLGINVLIRLNALPFGATVAGGVLLASAFQARGQARRWRCWVTSGLAMGLAVLTLTAPWLLRNQLIYGKPAFIVFQQRALLVYSSLHPSFDLRLPQIQAEIHDLGCQGVDYEWVGKLTERRGAAGAEAVAAQLLSEQWSMHPVARLRDILVSFVCYGGVYENRDENDRAPVRFWFKHFVGRVAGVHRQHSQSAVLADRIGFTYLPVGHDSALNRAWRRAGLDYLVQVRPALYLSFFGALLVRLLPWYRRRPDTDHEPAIRILAAGYLATAAFHAYTLTDSDRFASLYDWAALLVILLVAQRAFARRPARVPDQRLAVQAGSL